MPNLDLTDDEHAALVWLAKHALDTDRFPMSPRLSTPGEPREAGAAATPRAPVTTQGLRTAEGQRSPETATNGDLSHDSR
jgi:hypothetical protein